MMCADYKYLLTQKWKTKNKCVHTHIQTSETLSEINARLAAIFWYTPMNTPIYNSFNSHFPGITGLAREIQKLSKKTYGEGYSTILLQNGCPSRSPVNSIKAVKASVLKASSIQTFNKKNQFWIKPETATINLW